MKYGVNKSGRSTGQILSGNKIILPMILSNYHRPVLLPDVMDLLNIKKDRQYVDATLGGGGYSLAIVNRGGKVLGLDIDPEAIDFARQKARQERIGQEKWQIRQESFADIRLSAGKNGFSQVWGIIFDLGVSSHQLDFSGRGFSFRKGDEKLDMRFSGKNPLTAEEVINQYSKERLYEIFTKYAEELSAGTIAGAVVRARSLKKRISSVADLNRIIFEAVPGEAREQQKVLARIYQALRIEVNSELSTIEEGLREASGLLTNGGRMLVISYHSLEDRLVKGFFREKARSGEFKILTKSPVRPEFEEIRHNPRSRSAKLRAAEKI